MKKKEEKTLTKNSVSYLEPINATKLPGFTAPETNNNMDDEKSKLTRRSTTKKSE